MDKIKYGGREMRFEPINVPLLSLIQGLHRGDSHVVILEPGDATRYTLLLMPLDLGDSVSSHLGDFGISDAGEFMFVSKLAADLCRGTWIPYGPERMVGVWDVSDLTDNEWSRVFLSWWFTELYKLL